MNALNDVEKCIIYQSSVIELGSEVTMFLEEERMLILFNDTVPQELRDIAVIHLSSEVVGTIELGDKLIFGEQSYEITCVGNKVNDTFKELGHCTVIFNGESTADLPGILCVERKELPTIEVSTIFSFKKAAKGDLNC